MSSPLLIARTLDNALYLLPAMANRHGLITGATGTGKTVTLQKLAESFSEIGVPVFMADVKGDLTGIAAAGQSSEKLQARLEKIGVSDWGAARQPGGALGYLWREGPPGAGDGFRSRPPCCWRACSISTRCRAAY